MHATKPCSKTHANNSTQHCKFHELVTVCFAVTDLGWFAGKEVAQTAPLLGKHCGDSESAMWKECKIDLAQPGSTAMG
eukprot:464203-Rhodomonas_salina.1